MRRRWLEESAPTVEYEAEVERLVRDGEKTIGEVPRDLDLTRRRSDHDLSRPFGC
jgi:hypothetical protein